MASSNTEKVLAIGRGDCAMKKLVCLSTRVSNSQAGTLRSRLEGQKAAVEVYAECSAASHRRSHNRSETAVPKRADRPRDLDPKALVQAKAGRAPPWLSPSWTGSPATWAFTQRAYGLGLRFVCCDNPHANRLTIHILAASSRG